MRTGCNVLKTKRPYSVPLAFWTEQDILRFTLDNGLPIAKVGSVLI
jgi:3'-phosphoadenosine 5'-phosphosulfate sulfotransferase (PAPS reductase)/FAD synthetase